MPVINSQYFSQLISYLKWQAVISACYYLFIYTLLIVSFTVCIVTFCSLYDIVTRSSCRDFRGPILLFYPTMWLKYIHWALFQIFYGILHLIFLCLLANLRIYCLFYKATLTSIDQHAPVISCGHKLPKEVDLVRDN